MWKKNEIPCEKEKFFIQCQSSHVRCCWWSWIQLWKSDCLFYFYYSWLLSVLIWISNFFFLAFIYEIQIAIPLYIPIFFICGNKTEFFNQSINLSIIIKKTNTQHSWFLIFVTRQSIQDIIGITFSNGNYW